MSQLGFYNNKPIITIYHMFSDHINSQSQPITSDPNGQRVISHYGVDLTNYQCYKLSPNPVYSNYKNQDLHFAITAVQKGQKLPTKIGIKRTKRRNYRKKQKIQALLSRNDEDPQPKNPSQPKYIKPLNPKSPEEICLKALRRQFRQQIAPSTMEDQNASQASFKKTVKKSLQEKNLHRKPKFIRKKQGQKKRRIELITMVRQNYKILLPIFGYEKLTGFRNAKCPQISRQQVKDAMTIHYQQKIAEVNNSELIQKRILEREQSGKRNFSSFQRNHSQEYDQGSQNQEQRLVRASSSDDQSPNGSSESFSPDKCEENN